MKIVLSSFLVFFLLFLQSCGAKNESASENSKTNNKSQVPIQDTVTPVCKLKLNDIIGNYANKSGFSVVIKTAEKDSSKIDFVFQISKGCVRRYSGTATKEEFFSEDELNYISKDTINKVVYEYSLFFSQDKLSVTERSSEKKEKLNEKCIFEGHLTKLK